MFTTSRTYRTSGGPKVLNCSLAHLFFQSDTEVFCISCRAFNGRSNSCSPTLKVGAWEARPYGELNLTPQNFAHFGEQIFFFPTTRKVDQENCNECMQDFHIRVDDSYKNCHAPNSGT